MPFLHPCSLCYAVAPLPAFPSQSTLEEVARELFLCSPPSMHVVVKPPWSTNSTWKILQPAPTNNL